MALRGAVDTACNVGGRHRNPSLLSIPHYLKLKFHYPPSHALHRFTAFPIYQPGLKYPIRAISEATVDHLTPKKEDEEQSPQNWTIKMLYDGDCPLCMREVNMLRERNKNYGTIKFVDIIFDEYSPEENQGLDYKTKFPEKSRLNHLALCYDHGKVNDNFVKYLMVMGRIHAILSYGTVVTDVEAFRRLYEQVGLGWVYAITKYEPIATITDAIYGVWAKYRLQITGRPPLEDILELQKKNKDEVCNDKIHVRNELA